MDIELIKPGLKIKTNAKLGKTGVLNIKLIHLKARRPNTEGTVKNFVPGCGGDVWFVLHEDGSVAAYRTDEFECAPSS